MNMKPDTYKVVVNTNSEFWYDSNGKLIHYKDSNGLEKWYEYDANRNCIHYKDSNGLEQWWEYDANGKIIHYKDSHGYEKWYDANGNFISKKQFDAIHNAASCDGKVIEVEGKKYKLTAL